VSHGQHKNVVGVNLVNHQVTGRAEGHEEFSMLRVKVVCGPTGIREPFKQNSFFPNSLDSRYCRFFAFFFQK
jgi:hypothetical protein